MNRTIWPSKTIALILLLLVFLSGCRPDATGVPTGVPSGAPTGGPTAASDPTLPPQMPLLAYRPDADAVALLEAEIRGCFDFFYDTANTDPESPGYGLIPDRMPSGGDICSIASVGYGLAALCIGDQRKFEPNDALRMRALGTLKTLYENVQQEHGFFYHFLDMKTGQRAWNSEASIIDTAICLNGVLMAGSYFGEEAAQWAAKILDRVDWAWYADAEGRRFSMGYVPEDGFSGAWDMTAEQFMLYFLGAGSATHPTSGEMFYRFARPKAYYGGMPDMIRSPAGSLFVYQFSHAWFDFRNTVDAVGVDWFRNSTVASLSNRQYAIDKADELGSGALEWGFTACDGPDGYKGSYGAQPRAGGTDDGTIPPCGAAGSIVFTPEQSVKALQYMRDTYGATGLWGTWGFQDAYNRTKSPIWIAKDVIGIDKGVTLLMLENYLTGFVWNTMSMIPSVQAGMIRCGVLPADEVLLSSFEEGRIEGGAPEFGPYDAAVGVEHAKSTLQVTRTDADRGTSSLVVEAQVGGQVVFKLAPNVLKGLLEKDVEFRMSVKSTISGDGSLVLKLLDDSGGTILESASEEATMANSVLGNSWKVVSFDWVSAQGDLDLSRVKSVAIVFGTAGTYHIDDPAFKDPAPRIHSVLLDGGRAVGDSLRPLWQATDPEGREVLIRSIRWLSSDGPSGPWNTIEGANGAEFVIRIEDVGRFLACEIIGYVKEEALEIDTAPCRSESTRTIVS